ncbi:MAG: hypothetical protein ACK55Z_04365, partial [bacterium]
IALNFSFLRNTSQEQQKPLFRFGILKINLKTFIFLDRFCQHFLLSKTGQNRLSFIFFSAIPYSAGCAKF